MAAPRYSHDSDRDAESEALILHRLGTDPQGRPRIHTIPAGPRGGHDGDDDDAHDEDDPDDFDADLEKRRVRALAAQASSTNSGNISDASDKTGRPAWLVAALDRFRALSALYRALVATLALLVLCGIFYFALGPSSSSSATAAGTGLGSAWQWSGNFWKGGKMPYDFPQDMGYPGPTAQGPPADLADEDSKSYTGSGKKLWNPLPVEVDLGGQYGTFEPFHHMGPLTPYKASPGWGVDDAQYGKVPRGCRIEQVHYLSRHGSRYPTSHSPATQIASLLAASPRPTFTGPLAFLNAYQYRLGKELLVPLGRQQLYDEGAAAAVRYGRLIYADVAQHGTVFARAGSQHRIVESARQFLAGALGVDGYRSNATLEIQIEAPGFNTTLAPNFACPRAGDAALSPGATWMDAWVDDYAAAPARRLAPHAHGLDITPKLVFALQQLCAYDTVAGFDAVQMCSLFTEEEWLGLEYAWDLAFFGGYGSGSAVGAAQGVGWVNEFLARLTGRDWADVVGLSKEQAQAQAQGQAGRASAGTAAAAAAAEAYPTSENATLSGHPRTFPVRNRAFFADFTHDSTIANVLAALQLPDFARGMDVHRPDPARRYKTSDVVPFGARMVWEKMECSASASSGAGSTHAGTGAKETYLRLILNDAVVPLGQLPECAHRPDGMCKLEEFLRSQEKRMARAEWGKCFA